MAGLTAILNHAVHHHELPVVSLRDTAQRASFYRTPPSAKSLSKAVEGKAFFNHDDPAFGAAIARFLSDRFPDPCKYERA